MELFDRDDLKKALIYLSPIFIVLIIIILSTRSVGSKKDESSDNTYHYGNGTHSFTVSVNGNKIDLALSESEISSSCRGQYTHGKGSTVISGYDDETEEGLTAMSFVFNSPQYLGGGVQMPQGFLLSDEDDIIDMSFSSDTIRNKSSDGCNYYRQFFLDDKEIDYSEIDFSLAEGEGAYMRDLLMSSACEAYCEQKILQGDATICTSVYVTTAEKKCDTCIIKIIKKDGIDYAP